MDEQLGGDLSRLRQLNALTVVRALRGQQPQVVSDLVRRTGLSRPSCEDLLGVLLDQGWAAVEPPAAGGLGRPARRYRFRAEAGRVLGMDIGAYHVRAAIGDLDGAVLATAHLQIEPGCSYQERFAAVDAAAGECLRSAGLTPASLWAVTAGTTGIVDRAGTVTRSDSIPDWAGAPLLAHLESQYACPVVVENDSKLAALAEHRRGVARHVQHLVFLHAGRRTGAAMILAGSLYHGHTGATGEIGTLPASRWAGAAPELLASPVVPDGTPAEVAGELLFAAARGGDATAVAAVAAYTKRLAVGAAALVLTLDPQLVVLGGGFSRSGDVLVEPLRAALAELCPESPPLVVSSLGADSVTLGALSYAAEELEKRLFSVDSPGLPQPVPPTR
ncbi:ROK family protein [Longispora albida]|uniref:ROK family protein n=1 Tax=Longispora albida TaxID=203523 RepID=UPI00036DEBEA|nr:ROK family protein [Longispora albida]